MKMRSWAFVIWRRQTARGISIQGKAVLSHRFHRMQVHRLVVSLVNPLQCVFLDGTVSTGIRRSPAVSVSTQPLLTPQTAGSRPSTPAVTTAGTSAGSKPVSSDASNQRFKELMLEKKELKRILKKFDEDFAAKHGRLPVKSEKEVCFCRCSQRYSLIVVFPQVMRPMYQKYHELKHEMDQLRSHVDGGHSMPPSDDEYDMEPSSSSMPTERASDDRVFGESSDDFTAASKRQGISSRTTSKSGSERYFSSAYASCLWFFYPLVVHRTLPICKKKRSGCIHI